MYDIRVRERVNVKEIYVILCKNKEDKHEVKKRDGFHFLVRCDIAVKQYYGHNDKQIGKLKVERDQSSSCSFP